MPPVSHPFKTREWIKPGKDLPPKLRKLVEAWIEAHEEALLEQWQRARDNESIEVVG
ncbi:MAG: DUF4160 domain-containing protein [Phormidesmis sp.]